MDINRTDLDVKWNSFSTDIKFMEILLEIKLGLRGGKRFNGAGLNLIVSVECIRMKYS